MSEPFQRADGQDWIGQNHEYETLLRQGKLLYGHELTEQQQDRYDRLRIRLGEIVIERDEGGFR